MDNNLTQTKTGFKSFLKSFTPYQVIYLAAVCILTFAFVIFFPDMMLDSTEGILVTVCSIITVIANPLCELLIAKQSKLNFVVDFFFIEVTYLVISLALGWYTLAVTVVCFWMPIDVVSYIQWNKHPDREDKNLTQVKRLKPLQGVLIVLGIVAFGLTAGYLMQHIPGSEDSYLEAFASAVGMANGVLLLLRYSEQWFAWFLTTILYVFMDISSGAYILLITEVAMLVNTVYGFVKWLIYTRRHSAKEDGICLSGQADSQP